MNRINRYAKLLALGTASGFFSTWSHAQLTITEYLVPTDNGKPYDICSGADGNLWFTEESGNKIGRISPNGACTEFQVGTGDIALGKITAGPDGNLWFTEGHGNKIGRITPFGVLTEFQVATADSYPNGITTGPDGNLWFAESYAGPWPQFGRKVASISTAGAITEYSAPTEGCYPNAIASGADGNLWFTEYKANMIGRCTPFGVMLEFPVPSGGVSNPYGIVAGADGNLWFTEVAANKIGKITPTGLITEFPLPGGDQPYLINTGPDGNIWFTAGLNHIGRITASGSITMFFVGLNCNPTGICTGPDGNVWFTEYTGNKIGKISFVQPLISGNVVLGDYVGDVTSEPVTLEVRTPGSTTPLVSHTLNLDSGGNFSFTDKLPTGTYEVTAKGSHWLREKQVAVITSTVVSGLNFTLTNGDVNGDNVIDLTDYTGVVTDFNSIVGDPNYHTSTDLNGDGVIDLTDYTILVTQFNGVGD